MFISDRYILTKSIFGLQSMEKFILFMVLLSAALLLKNSYMHLFLIFTIIIGFCTHGMKVRKLARLIALPFGFIVLGSISIAFTLNTEPSDSLFCIDAMGICIGLGNVGLYKAIALFCKAMAAVMALNYLILSCSLSEINDLGRRLRVPLILRELFVLTYRYISLLFSFTNQVQVAQRNRLGYVSRRRSIRSYGMLFSSVFIKNLLFSSHSFQAMESRGYHGELYFRQNQDKIRPLQVVMSVGFGALLLIIDLLCF